MFVLQFNADSLQSDQQPLMDATNVIDDQTTITGYLRDRRAAQAQGGPPTLS